MIDQTFSELRKDAAYDTDSGHSFVDTEQLRALIAAYDASSKHVLKPVNKQTPKNRPILAWCDHEVVDYQDPNDPTRLTTYAAHAEGLSHAATGWHIVCWGGEYEESDWESGIRIRIPDWWFVADGDWETVANPIFWMELPKVPDYKKVDELS